MDDIVTDRHDVAEECGRPGEVTVIARRAADGDEQAWEALVNQYSGLVWSVVRSFRLGQEQSADVVQTTWLRLVENIQLIRDPERLPGWLKMTARNLSLDAIRYARRLQPLHESHDTPSSEEPPELVVLRVERATLVREALKRLPERDQQLLGLLVASPPVPYEEISAKLGMPMGSIGPTRMRALHRLRLELERSGMV